MTPGQRIVFDENHHSGVYARVMAREARDCCAQPRQKLDHPLMVARRYWENRPNPQNQPPVVEYLADGENEVLEIVKEIGKNL